MDMSTTRGTRRWLRTPPLLDWCRGYQRKWLLADSVTGVLIVTIAIPLSIGMAEVAGVPPVAGLYTCVFPLVAYAIFGSSRHLVLGLDASTAAMVAATVGPLAASDPQRYLALANMLALLAGLVCLLAGFLRLGVIAELLSTASLLGYQAGLAVAVIINQLPRLMRVPGRGDGSLDRIAELARSLDEIHLPSMLIGVVVLTGIIIARRWRPHVPASFVLLILASLIVWLGKLNTDGVAIIDNIPSGAPPVGWPAIKVGDFIDLLPSAAAIALVASADTLASARAFAARNHYRVETDRELAGLGAANVVSGLTGGIAASASAARTAVAESTGAHTPLASVVAGIVLLVVLTTLTAPLELVPIAALAAVVIAALIRLIDVNEFRTTWRSSRTQFLLATLIAATVVLVGVLEALVLALVIEAAQRFGPSITRPRDQRE